MIPTAKETSDEKFNSNFEALLGEFNAVCEKPLTDKTRATIAEIQKKAASMSLTYRQSDAIHTRCKHYLAGTYGKDAHKEKYMKENKAA